MSVKTYDIVIMGAGVGGLSAALNCAKNGYKVAVIEKGPIGGKAAQIPANQNKGFIFDPGPSIIIMPWVYQKLIWSLGRNPKDYLQFIPLQNSFKIFFQNEKNIIETYTIPSGQKEFLEFIKQNFAQDLKSFEWYFKAAKYLYQLSKQSVFTKNYSKPGDFLDFNLFKMIKYITVFTPYKKLIDKLFTSNIFKAFLYGFPSYSGQDYHSISIGGFLIPYIIITEGVYYPQNGIGQIPKTFYDICKEMGVDFFEDEVIKVNILNNQINQISTTKNTFIAKYFISNIDKTYFQNKFLGQSIDHQPSYSYFTLQLGLNKKLENLQHHNVFIPNNYALAYQQLYDLKTLPDVPIFYINAPVTIHPETAPTNYENIFIVISSPANNLKVNWKVITQHAQEYFLFLLKSFDINISRQDIIISRIQTPVYFYEQHNNFKGSLYGPEEKFRGPFGLPQSIFDEKYKNLLYCGGSVQPGAGLPMVTLAGKFCADYIKKYD